MYKLKKMSIPTKLQKQTEFVAKLRYASISVTVLSIVVSSILLTTRYEQLKTQYESSIRNKLYNEFFFQSNINEFDREIKQEEIHDKWMDTIIDDKTIDYWIKFQLSKMGQMSNEEYKIYYNTYNKELISKEIKEYNIKLEQEIEVDKNSREDDLLNQKRFYEFEIAVNKKMNDADIIVMFPLSYLLGAFFGTLFFPGLFWLSWYYYKRKLI
jgi:hypothetical protein